jgi:NADH-quinone oxidoreductase subunit C
MTDETPKSPEPPKGEPPAAEPAATTPLAPKPAAAPPAAPPKPKGPEAKDASGHPLVKSIAAAVDGGVVSAKELVSEITVEVPREKIVDVCRHLRDSEDFGYLVELFGVDYMNWKGWSGDRFGVFYLLYSHSKNDRIRLRIGAADGVAVPTVTPVWPAANWLEREAWDLLGIPFAGHPNLERILTWEGFNGHPLRKDFPLEGIDTGAAIYPDEWPAGGGPPAKDTNKKVVS